MDAELFGVTEGVSRVAGVVPVFPGRLTGFSVTASGFSGRLSGFPVAVTVRAVSV